MVSTSWHKDLSGPKRTPAVDVANIQSHNQEEEASQKGHLGSTNLTVDAYKPSPESRLQ